MQLKFQTETCITENLSQKQQIPTVFASKSKHYIFA